MSSIAAIEDHWILHKRNMLKEIIKMKKPFQVCGYSFLAALGYYNFIFFIIIIIILGIIRDSPGARAAMRNVRWQVVR